MYNIKLFFIFVMIFISILSCSSSKSSSLISDSVLYLTDGEGDWAVRIDDIKIPKETFDKDLIAFMKLNGQNDQQIEIARNDNNTKQIYADKIINDILLLNKAKEEKFFESEEAKSIINSALRNVQIQYYTQYLISEASKNIPTPTEEQARAFYEQAATQIAQQFGITEFSTQTRPSIDQLYKIAFAEQMIQRDISDLKDKAVIERNKDVLGETTFIPSTNMGIGTQEGVLPRGNAN